MKFVVSKRVIIISIGVIVVSALTIGGYYYYTNIQQVDDVIDEYNPSADTDKIYLPSYSNTGFLVESPVEGVFWRFETVRPVFQGYMSEGGRDYIDAYITSTADVDVPVGIYISGDLSTIDKENLSPSDHVWVRPEYDNEGEVLPEKFGETWTYEELKENWNIKKGEQFEVYILSSGPQESDLDHICAASEFNNYCRQSSLLLSNKWNIYDVYKQGAAFPVVGLQFVEIFPNFIGTIIE